MSEESLWDQYMMRLLDSSEFIVGNILVRQTSLSMPIGDLTVECNSIKCYRNNGSFWYQILYQLEGHDLRLSATKVSEDDLSVVFHF